MRRFARTARSSLPIAFLVGSAMVIVIACGGSSEGVDGSSSGGPDGSTAGDATPGTDDASPGTTADAGDAGEAVTDGGANLDPDAGEPPTLPDGGKCNELANTAKAVVSTCASLAPILGGGTVVPGTYELASVVALATPNFCANQFVPAGIKQTLAVTASGNAFSYESVVEIGGTGARHRDGTLTPNGQNKLQLAQTCPIASAAEGTYATGVVAGKQRLVIRQAYGRGEALYTYQLR